MRFDPIFSVSFSACKKTALLTVAVLFCTAFLALPHAAYAARLVVSPSSGIFTVDSTFDVSIILDTENETINAFTVALRFPPDKLQISSPAAGQSIVGVWTSPPKYNNSEGTVSLSGGIPGGIKTSQGLIATLSFRVKSSGSVALRFTDNSRILLNDGKGTDVLEDTQSGVFELVLPPPQGPLVASETHPDQSKWYPLTTAILRWAAEAGAEGYSYILNRDPVDVPDTISDGMRNGVTYTALDSGTHYFHIRARRGGVWGGVTHFAFNVDTEPPAEFPIEIAPSTRTTSKTPIISFQTTDVHSGLSHYEYKIIPLSSGQLSEDNAKLFFIEVPSGQQVLHLPIGSYDVYARAYDKAGNWRESVERLSIVTPLLQFVNGDGLRIFDLFNISWLWVILLGIVLLTGLVWLGQKARNWHLRIDIQRAARELPKDTEHKLEELKKYREKYGKITAFFFVAASLMSLAWGNTVFAQQAELSPPFVEAVSRDISNEEIFYIGGKTDVPNAEVIIYLQNLKTGETWSHTVMSDKTYEWFYRHTSFLSTGNYLLWTQTRVGDTLSPPSPQINLTVRATAIQFGSSRLSFEVLYLMFVFALLIAVAGLVSYILFHVYHGRRKHLAFVKEVREAEESVRRGFAVLRRDIEAEIAVHKKNTGGRELSSEEIEKEQQLLKDLEWVERHVSKEIWDVKDTDHYH